MTQSTRFLILAAVAGSVLGTVRLAKAQADTVLPLPNVLLLVDDSGSMEYKSSGDALPHCDPADPDASEKSRWIELVEVLTGAIPDYRCQDVDRTQSPFRTEYALGGRSPYDYGYPKPYHRPVSGECTWGPGNASTTNAYLYLDDAIRFHRYDDATVACSTAPPDPRNGLLDGFVHQVRFGLMTFDSLTNRGTGVSGTAADYADGIRGTWSYFPSGTPAKGRPLNCGLPMADYEVGARNAAAPPWEGRLIAFGPPPDSSDVSRRNEWIQKTLLAMRPYGATPIAGMLRDAYDFLWNDTSTDPLNTNPSYPDFGPRNDPYIAGGCRETHIILLTDGEPNTDLRPDCGTEVPPCPYETTSELAWDLAHNPDPNKDVKVHVIGFALPSITLQDGTPLDCTELTDSDLNAGGLCDAHTEEKALQACCTLHRIALNGDTGRAMFAGNRAELREAIASILTELVPTTSRTVPSFSSGAAAFGGAAGFRFLSSFRPTREGVWAGTLERQRFSCNDDLEPEAQAIEASEGDDFAANVNSGAGPTRVIGTVLGETRSGAIRSEASIRPGVTEDDGAGIYTNQAFDPASPTDWANNTPAAAVIRPGTDCGSTESAQQCSTRYLGWAVGLNDGHFDTTGGPEDHRCPVPGETCNLLGSIYHSSPVAVNRPKELLRDETYELFAAQKATRPLMLYTSSTDGFFHAFKVAANDPTDTLLVDHLENNELWAFVPPAMLPQLPTEYPDATTRLLDAVPVVKDVVATLGDDGRYRFERTATGARANESTWRTVLVQGLGLTPGYFALDVTDPESGPSFLWQLTTDAEGHQLFGQSSTAPLITTLFFGEGTEEPREVAVAVLPGGPGPAGGTACARSTSSSVIDDDFPPRAQVPCYTDPRALRGRSLTIVRLDTGQVVRTFRRDAAEVVCPATGTCLRDRVIDALQAPLDSPLTGQPVAFPGEAGAVADRVFVGDQDGGLWRVDLSATSPDAWSMRLFFDAYWGESRAFDVGQPIETQPVLSVNDDGNVTIALSTGSQDLVTSADQVNYVFSLTEVPRAGHPNETETKVNWYEELTGGNRVTGPISIFASALYFSTYQPPTGAQVCDTGASCLWGLHYINSDQISGGENVPASGGAQALPDDLTGGLPSGQKCVPGSDDADALFAPGAVIFGVSVVQLPSCVLEDATDFTDDFTGQTTASGHRRIESITPASFQLVMQTGSKGTEVQGGQTKISSVALPPPNTSPRIDSWAAIID
jgi:type IV pilus assembly protein PilY1